MVTSWPIHLVHLGQGVQPWLLRPGRGVCPTACREQVVTACGGPARDPLAARRPKTQHTLCHWQFSLSACPSVPHTIIIPLAPNSFPSTAIVASQNAWLPQSSPCHNVHACHTPAHHNCQMLLESSQGARVSLPQPPCLHHSKHLVELPPKLTTCLATLPGNFPWQPSLATLPLNT